MSLVLLLSRLRASGGGAGARLSLGRLKLGFGKASGGSGGGGGGSSSTPFYSFVGMNKIDTYRSYLDVPFTDLWSASDDFYYNGTVAGNNAVVPAANRDANGWVTSLPSDMIGSDFFCYPRFPLAAGACAFTWTGAFNSLSTSDPGLTITGVGANSATITYLVNNNKFTTNGQVKFQINVGNPPKNFSIIPSGRSASNVFTAEALANRDLYIGSGAHRPIKHFPHVEGSWVVTSRNTTSSAVWTANDGVPFEHELTYAGNRPFHWNIGLKEADAVITAKALLLLAWLQGDTARRALLESGNESWNSFYYANQLYLRGLSAIDGLDGSSAGAVINTITHSGATATVTTNTAHGLATNDYVTTVGQTPGDYCMAPVQITNTGANTFTYVMFSTPTANASVVGQYFKYPSGIGSVYDGQLKEHSKRSSYVMDLVEATVGSSIMRAQVVRQLGGNNTIPANNTTQMAYSTTAAKHDALAIATYVGNKYDVYPADGMTRGSPAPYADSDWPAIAADWKTGIDTTFAYTSQNITAAAAQGLKLTGYEFGKDRAITGNVRTISSITRGGAGNLTATVTTSAAHNLVTGDTIGKSGTTPAGFDLDVDTAITVTGSTTFTYQMLADPGGNASVVGVYSTKGPVTRWSNSVDCKNAVKYALQEWERLTLGAHPSIMNFSNANWFVDIGDFTLETGANRGLIRYLGDGVSGAGQALIDFNGNGASSRVPNDLVGTISVSAGAANGTVVATLTKFNVGSTIAVVAGGSGLGVTGNTTTSPTCAVTVTNSAALSPGATSVTLRETDSRFAAPGYHDTVFAYTVGAALNNTHAYRYYRINGTNVPNGNIGLAELQIAAVPGGANTATGQSASANTTSAGAAANMIDGSGATIWVSVGNPGILTVDYGATSGNWIAANEFKVIARNDGGYVGSPVSYTIDGSDNNSSWTTLITRSGLTWSQGETKTDVV